MAGGGVLRGGQVSIRARREEIENMGDFCRHQDKIPEIPEQGFVGLGELEIGLEI